MIFSGINVQRHVLGSGSGGSVLTPKTSHHAYCWKAQYKLLYLYARLPVYDFCKALRVLVCECVKRRNVAVLRRFSTCLLIECTPGLGIVLNS